MVIKKILVFVVPLFISFFKGQINEDSIKAINNLYAQYYTSAVLTMSPTHKWAIISDKNSYGLERAHLVQLQTGKSEDIPLSYNNYFFGDNLLIIQENERTIVKSLKNKNTIQLKGNYLYEAFDKVGKLLFYDRLKKELLLFDSAGNKLRSYEDIESIGKSHEQSQIVFRNSSQTFKFDLKKLELTQWKSEDKVYWQRLLNEDVISLESNGQNYLIRHYGKLNNIKTKILHIQEGFYLDSLSTAKMTLKQNRYLILPLVKKIDKSKVQQSLILYTNQNAYYKTPMSQMAVFDLTESKWKRLPEGSDFFSRQILLDDFGTIMSFDPSVDKIENESNVTHQMTIEKKFGESKIMIDNSHERKQNYYYDGLTNRMIYFQDQKWKIENLNNGLVSEIPFEKPSNFTSWVYNGLSDYSSGNAYSTNKKGFWIISDGYDLFLVDLIHVTAKRLTFGREKDISFSIQEDFRTKYLNESYWDIPKILQVNMNRKLILKAFNTTNYTSGIAELDIKNLRLKMLATLDDVIQEVFVTDENITFTVQSYNQPLSDLNQSPFDFLTAIVWHFGPF
ncbi:hypothetical protein DRF58_12825 [Epilithonimonas hispanica]|uniref:Uncharacterized protein n=2 Tax=Epilithonimonas hispanica TaxID=358687 RepID=A0A3D9CU31_9FLAO|nr:hypothetical protein DRF58_12825 [Epilithonimonas hispanica]